MGRLCVTVHTESVPSDEDWNAYMTGVKRDVPMAEQRVLVVSAGGGPDGKQRKMMVDTLNGTHVPVAILTDSWVMRGAGIAISWFNPSLKVYGPNDLEPALAYLELTTRERRQTAQALRELQQALGLDILRLRTVG